MLCFSVLAMHARRQRVTTAVALKAAGGCVFIVIEQKKQVLHKRVLAVYEQRAIC